MTKVRKSQNNIQFYNSVLNQEMWKKLGNAEELCCNSISDTRKKQSLNEYLYPKIKDS